MKQYDTWNLPQNDLGEVRVSGGLDEIDWSCNYSY